MKEQVNNKINIYVIKCKICEIYRKYVRKGVKELCKLMEIEEE